MAWFLVPWFLVPFNQIETSHNRKDSVYSKTQNSKKLKNKNSLQMHTLFTSNTLMSNARLTLKKKMLSKSLRLIFCESKSIHIFHPRYHSKMIRHILKNKQKNKCVCFHNIIQLIMIKL